MIDLLEGGVLRELIREDFLELLERVLTAVLPQRVFDDLRGLLNEFREEFLGVEDVERDSLLGLEVLP